MQSLFSIATLRKLSLECMDFRDSEIVDVFRSGMEQSSLQALNMSDVSFRPEQNKPVAATSAHSDTLVKFDYAGASQLFAEYFCVTLWNNGVRFVWGKYLGLSPRRPWRNYRARHGYDGRHSTSSGTQCGAHDVVAKQASYYRWIEGGALTIWLDTSFSSADDKDWPFIVNSAPLE